MGQPAEPTLNATKKIRIRSIKAGSLLSLTFVGVFSVLVPLELLCGILGLFGIRTIFVNVGLAGLIGSLIYAPLSSFFVAIAVWLCMYMGILIWGSLGPITIEYVAAKDTRD
jgi:hypothetical protein